MIFHDCDGEKIPYDGSQLSWRVSAYVLVQRGDELLLIKNREEKLYDIPGGGIEMDETIEEAITRECMEEAGARVRIGEILHATQDYFYHREHKQFFKTIQLFYAATLLGEIGTPTDQRTEFVEFIPMNRVVEYALPTSVLEAVRKYETTKY